MDVHHTVTDDAISNVTPGYSSSKVHTPSLPIPPAPQVTPLIL